MNLPNCPSTDSLRSRSANINIPISWNSCGVVFSLPFLVADVGVPSSYSLPLVAASFFLVADGYGESRVVLPPPVVTILTFSLGEASSYPQGSCISCVLALLKLS